MGNFKNILLFSIYFLFDISALKAQGIQITNGAKLILNTSGSIVTNNHWINNGQFVANGGNVYFTGIKMDIAGNNLSSFYNMNVLDGASTNIQTQGVQVQSKLKVDGTLNANGNLTLLANKDLTALVDGSGIGNVNGTVFVQAYMANVFGYKYLGAPVQNATIGQLASHVDLNASFPSVYSNNENSLSNGWVNYMQATNLMDPMRGYAFQFGNSNLPKRFTFNGLLNNGDMGINLQNSNNPYTKGFNLVSNPYPSLINWDAVGWNKNNIDNAIYYFDADTADLYGGVYNTYINGISSDGKVNNIIPEFQSFFVHVTDGAYPVYGNLAFTNTIRVNYINTNDRKINNNLIPSLGISAHFKANTKSDFTIIYKDDNGSEKFDPNIDALKLMNTSEIVPSIYSIKSNRLLAINAISSMDTSTIFPLGIHMPKEGMVVIDKNHDNLPLSFTNVYFIDKAMNKYIDYNELNNYEVFLSKGNTEQRFFIQFSNKNISNISKDAASLNHDALTVFVKQEQLILSISKIENKKASIQITDMLGGILLNRDFTKIGMYEINLPVVNGIYFVTYYSGNTKLTKKIFIGE